MVAESIAKSWNCSESELCLAALVRRMAGGCQVALAEFYDRTSRLVYGLAYRIVLDVTCAEDITQDVYLQVWRSAGTFDGQRGTVTSWLVTIVRSRSLDRLRARRRQASLLQQDEAEIGSRSDPRPDPESASVAAARARQIQDALAALPPGERQAIELAYFDGFSHSEIVVKTGFALGTVKTRIRRGMARLRNSLDALPGLSGQELSSY